MDRSRAKAARLIGFYLPQFHPTPENDAWWGKGFTEWTNVAKARPLFPGHYQPRIPADLGFYDLRVPETREAQADLARRHGVEAFCYWHYWFAGRRMLERPFEEVLRSGQPRFPFCLGWANETWTGIWMGAKDHILIEQTYPGPQDHADHFRYLLRAFTDDRYVLVDGKPLFLVYHPKSLPDPLMVTDLWRELAHRAGLKGLHLVAHVDHYELPYDPRTLGFDALCVANQLRIYSLVNSSAIRRALRRRGNGRSPREELQDQYILRKYQIERRLRTLAGQPPHVFRYRDAMRYFLPDPNHGVRQYPCLVPNWDHSPRCGARSVILHDSTPELFRTHTRQVLDSVRSLPPDDRVVFIKSWNEWAEGNYLEPDLRHGDAYLKVLRDEVYREAN